MKYTVKMLSAIVSATLCASGASAPLIANNVKDTAAAPAYTVMTTEMVDAEALAPQSAATAKSSETVIADELEVEATTTEAESTTTATAISEACEPSEAPAPLQTDVVLIEAPEAPCMTTMTDAYEFPTKTTTTEAAATGIGAIAPEPDSTISSTEWYVKPGDQKVFTDKQVVLTFTDFVKVTEATVWDGNTYWTELSGFTPAIGEWKICFTAARVIGDGPSLPFTIDRGIYALGLPLAAEYGPVTLNGWTLNAADDEVVSYCQTTGVTYVSGEGWDAMVLDDIRYGEWKYSHADDENFADNFQNKEDYSLVGYANDSWVIATANAPEIVREGIEKGKELTISEVAEKLADATPLVGFNDPKWGAISWDEFGREDWTEGPGATHYLGGTIDGNSFEIAIDSTDHVLGFCPEFSWQAAIVPRDFVAYEDVSSLIWGDYTIYCDDATGNTVRIYQSSTGNSCDFELNTPARMDTAVMLITITDGKHATVITCRPELVAFIYALAQ